MSRTRLAARPRGPARSRRSPRRTAFDEEVGHALLGYPRECGELGNARARSRDMAEDRAVRRTD
jgi:hypothetical protein